MSNHTPTPWYSDGLRIAAKDFGDGHSWQVAKAIPWAGDRWEDAQGNAEFIVRAVNAHDALLEACRLMLKCDEYSPDWHVPEAIEAARAAIAKATT